MRQTTKNTSFVLQLAAVLLILCIAATARSTGGGSEPPSPHNLHTRNRDACASCHIPHIAGARKLVRGQTLFDVCIACHNGTGPPPFPGDINRPDRVHRFGENAGLSCHGCHKLHPPYGYQPLLLRQYTGERLTVNLENTQYTSDYLLCLDCHNNYPFTSWKSAGDIARYYLNGTGHYLRSAGGLFPPGWQLSCSNCHQPHGSANAKYVRESITVQVETAPSQTVDEVVYLSYPVSPGSPSQLRGLCLSCHTAGRFVYRIPMQRSPSISEHDETGTEACTECHGHVSGADPQYRMQRGIHAPLVPVPTITESVYELIYQDVKYVELTLRLEYDGLHLSAPRLLPFRHKLVVFRVVSGDGTFQTMSGTLEDPVFTDIGTSQEASTNEHGLLSVWVKVPPGTTVIGCNFDRGSKTVQLSGL